MPKITVQVPLEVTGLPGRLRVAMKAVATASGLPKLTQAQLQHQCGVAQSSISRLLNEKRAGGGHIAHAVLIARALGVRPAWLMTGEEPMRAAGQEVPIYREPLPSAPRSDDDEKRPRS